MVKQLSQSTIIPEHLYVERNADVQLREVIEDMGRPGYILVARQMGKTNLLINAKRRLEGRDDIFAYIDLSNRFETARECFRNIIETILETCGDKLNGVSEAIYEERENRELVPHREHVQELRKILTAISGKLIINLDEIDSLTAAEYSDKIFAQIRSVYFERVNFKEFERLGYIISGVAEPSEIIKDKSISPFNIGQKILLGDFTYDEFSTFLSKASLDFDDLVVERIFYWVNGNPRLTWEVCSELESIIERGGAISVDDVDGVVNDLYLAKYDRPPVDHIRSLVQDDKELRDAVVSIHYNKSEALSDRVKSRLYLAGILGTDYEYGDVRIKNRVVEKSLDERWLSDIEKKESQSITSADIKFKVCDYKGAGEIYQKVIEEGVDSIDELMHSRYRLGVCYFHQGEYQKAIGCYEEHLFDKKGSRDIYMEQIYTLAMSYLSLHDLDVSLRYFDEIISEKVDDYYYESLVSKSNILSLINEVDNKELAIEINEKVIESYESGLGVSPYAASAAYYSLATIYEKSNKNTLAYECYLKSSEVASDKDKVAPLISALRINQEDISSLWDTIIEALSSGETKFDVESHQTGLSLTLPKLSNLIGIAVSRSMFESLEQLNECIINNCLGDVHNYSSILHQLALTSLNKTRLEDAKYLFNKIITTDRGLVDPDSLFQANKYLAYMESDSLEYSDCYFKGFQNYVETVDVIDVVLFERRIVLCINNAEFAKAEKYCDLIISLEGLNNHESRVKLISILFLKMRSISEQHGKLMQAHEVKEIIENTKKEDLKITHINESILKNIKRETERTIVSMTPIKQIVKSERSYGRNERVTVKYADGRVETKKYKFVKEGVLNGLCHIVEEK